MDRILRWVKAESATAPIVSIALHSRSFAHRCHLSPLPCHPHKQCVAYPLPINPTRFPPPMHRTLLELHDDDKDFGSDSVLSSPSQRSFADLLEDTVMNEQPMSPPQSPLLVGQPLLMLPGAEPDNSLIMAETPAPDWSGASPPCGSGLGLFLPI